MTDIAHTKVRPRRRFRLPFAHWRAVWRSRRALSRLDPHLLRDIGVSDFAARQEAARPPVGCACAMAGRAMTC